MLPFTRVCLYCSFHSVSMNTNQFIIALFALGMCTHLVSAGPALWAANEAYIDALNPTASLSTDGGLVNLTWVVDDVVAGFVYDVSFVGRTCNLASAIVWETYSDAGAGTTQFSADFSYSDLTGCGMTESTGATENVLEGKVNFHLDDGDGVNLDLLVFERNITVTYDLTTGAFISVEVSGNIAQANISTTVYTDSTLTIYDDNTFVTSVPSPEYLIGEDTFAELQLDSSTDFTLTLTRVRYSLSTDIDDASQAIRDIPLVDITTVNSAGGLIQFSYTTPRVVGCTPCNLHVETSLAAVTKRGLLARDETPTDSKSTKSVTVRDEVANNDDSTGTDDVSSGSSSVAVIASVSAGVAVAAVMVAFFAHRRHTANAMANSVKVVNIAPATSSHSPLMRTPSGGLRRKPSRGSLDSLEPSVLPGSSA